MNEIRFISKAWKFLGKLPIARRNPQEEEVEILPPMLAAQAEAARPQQQRTIEVFESLDRASEKGLTTYAELINFVRQQTGKGCSATLVSKWKKERGLVIVKPSQVQDDYHESTTEELQIYWRKLIKAVAVIGTGLFVIGAIEPYGEPTQTETASQNLYIPVAPPSPVAPPPVAPPNHSSNLPRILKFELSVSSPKDLRIKQGDKVEAGQVLADRVEERSHLTAQLEALNLEYQQIQSKTISTPPAPVSVPTIKSLPPISYAEEEAAIRVTQTNLSQAKRAVQLQQEKLKAEPLEESAAVQRAAVEVQNRHRLVDKQKRKIEAVALLKNLPDSIGIHEREVLKQKQAELKQAEAEYKQAQAKLSAASQAEVEKLHQLRAALEKAQADLQLSVAKLHTKKDQRAYAEYEASITAARLASERNEAASNYSRQLLETKQQQRDRSFQLAQLKTKIASVNNELRSLSVVTSPYNGVIRSLRILSQTNNQLSIKIILGVDDTATPAPSPSPEIREV